MVMVADLAEDRLSTIRARFPLVVTTLDYLQLLHNEAIEAVVVATPVSTHARLVREALVAGKHVLVEKPITDSGATAEGLIELAAQSNRVLMVGHTFLFNPAVEVLRNLVHCGELGDIYYAHAQRLNLGLFQRDINVLWDLAPHDISILMHVLGAEPIAAGAHGAAYVQHGIEDVAYVNLAFPKRTSAAIHVSWLDPNKVRRITIVGSRKMAVYDDVQTLEKIRVYDRSVHAPPHTDGFGEFQLSYRYGSITIPHLPSAEPLRLEDEHFLECIRTGRVPLTDGRQGLQVVRVLEPAHASLSAGGALFPVPQQAAACSHSDGTAEMQLIPA